MFHCAFRNVSIHGSRHSRSSIPVSAGNSPVRLYQSRFPLADVLVWWRHQLCLNEIRDLESTGRELLCHHGLTDEVRIMELHNVNGVFVEAMYVGSDAVDASEIFIGHCGTVNHYVLLVEAPVGTVAEPFDATMVPG